jgi:hypothetical protein
MNGRTVVGGLLVAWGVVLGLHVALGWAWTVGGGVLVGLWRPRRGWVWGASGGALGWASLVGYTAATAPASLRLLLETVGALGGNIPEEAVVGATVVLGSALGALGGVLGSAVRLLLPASARQYRFARLFSQRPNGS